MLTRNIRIAKGWYALPCPARFNAQTPVQSPSKTPQLCMHTNTTRPAYRSRRSIRTQTRAVLNPSSLNPLPLRITPLRSRDCIPACSIAHVLQRNPIPLQSTRGGRVSKRRRFVRACATAGTGAHSVVGGAGHADAAVGVMVGVCEAGVRTVEGRCSGGGVRGACAA